MAFSGGVYTLPGPALNTGEIVSASENNSFRNDVAAAFNLTFLRNGTSTATANLPMGGYKLTGLGVATTSGDALSYGQAAVVTTLTSTSLTATRVPYAGTGGLLQDASTFTFDGTTLTAGGFSGPHNGTVGATTPNTGAFTTLSASSTVTVSGGTANGVAYLNGSKVLTTGSAFVFDGSNLGLGVTPSAWSSGGYINIGSTKGVYATGTQINVGANLFYDGAIKYVTTGAATYLSQDAGAFKFFNAPSGTAGSAISFTQAMTLDASGNLGIGTSSPGRKLDVSAASSAQGIISTTTGNAAYLLLQNSADSSNAYVYATGKELRLSQADASASSIVTFATQNTERMRIDSSGNLLVGTTSAVLSSSGRGNITVNGSSSAIISVGVGGGGKGWLYADASNTYLAAAQDGSRALIFETNSSERMRIDSSGNLLVGTTTTRDAKVVAAGNSAAYSFRSDAASTAGTYYHFTFNPAGGTQAGFISSSTTTTSYVTSSDYRLKENIQPMQNALATVAQLNPVTYTWKADGSDGQGFIAHELQAVVPDCVTGEKDAVDAEGKPVYQGIDTSFLVATLTKAIQEQQTLIVELQARLEKAGL